MSKYEMQIRKTGQYYDEAIRVAESDDYQRLPCRGCTRNCGYYKQCRGKPWRM